MENIVELIENQTSLKNQKPFGLDVLLISTSLMLFNGINQSEVNRKLVEGQRLRNYNGSIPIGNENHLLGLNYGSTSQNGTTVDLYPPTFAYTTLGYDYPDGIDDNDFAVVPKFNKEFKIKVTSLRIDKSLPKIFVD